MRNTLGVMRGLDPRIHDAMPCANSYCQGCWLFLMDCRVRPGNDGGGVMRNTLGVMRGLDPRIHDEPPNKRTYNRSC
jgi:hypothetical protein